MRCGQEPRSTFKYQAMISKQKPSENALFMQLDKNISIDLNTIIQG